MNQVDIFDGDMKPEVKAFITMFTTATGCDGHGPKKLAENLSRRSMNRSKRRAVALRRPKFLATPLEVLTRIGRSTRERT